MVEPMIKTEQLTRRFGEVTAVDRLDLTVQPGELFGLVGPDGAGKTTTLRLLVGALEPTSGRASIAGLDRQRDSEQIGRLIGYVSQRFSLYGDLTVMENLTLLADLFGVPRQLAQRRVDRLLALTGLEAARQRRADLLSGGMKQKLALVGALLREPPLLILDEPTNGVDPIARREFWRLLTGLLADGTTILISTAYLDEAELCARVGFMAAGRLLVAGTPAELRAQVPSCLVLVQAQPRPLAVAVARAVAGVEDVQVFGDRLHVAFPVTPTPAVAVAALREALLGAGVMVETIRPITPSLEDVVIRLSQTSGAAA